MATLADLYNAVNSVDVDIVCEDAFNENAEYAAQLNIQQLDMGMNADGGYNRDYSDTSVYVYGKRPGPATLEDTGAFKAGIKYEAYGGIVYGYSTDEKSKILQDDYGVSILGIGDMSKVKLKPRLQESVYKILTSRYGLK